MPVISLVAFASLLLFFPRTDIQLLKYICCSKFTCTILVFPHKCHLFLLIALAKVRSQHCLGCPIKGHGLIPCCRDMLSCSLRLSVLFPTAFPQHSPHWAHTGGGTTTLCVYWCSPAQAGREIRWLSLGAEGLQNSQVCLDMIQCPFMVDVDHPNFIWYFHSKLPCKIIHSSVKKLTMPALCD